MGLGDQRGDGEAGPGAYQTGECIAGVWQGASALRGKSSGTERYPAFMPGAVSRRSASVPRQLPVFGIDAVRYRLYRQIRKPCGVFPP